MTFHIDHQMPMASLRNDQPYRRFLGNAAEKLMLQRFGEALEIRAIHQPDIGNGRERDFDHRSGALFPEIVVAIAEGRLRHCLLFYGYLAKVYLGAVKEAFGEILSKPAKGKFSAGLTGRG